MNATFIKIIAKFNTLDIKVRYAIFAVLLLSVAALDYVLIMQFQLGALKGLDQQIKKIADDTEGVKTDKERIGQIKQNLELARLHMKQMSGKIRSIEDAAMLSEDINRIASDEHIVLDQIAPAKEGQEPLVTVGNTKYYALPVVLNAHSGYHMFGHFLNKLNESQLLFTIKSLKLEGSEKENANIAIQATLKIIMADTPGGSK